MLHFLIGSELKQHPKLRETMLKDRKTQFVDRLKWPLHVTPEGYEVDEYDTPETVYIICADADGHHLGSIRLLPTKGAHMIGDHFGDIIPGIRINTKNIWECTRFCIARKGGTKIAKTLLAASAKFMRENNVLAFLGAFDNRIERVYSKIGTSPFILGAQTTNERSVKIGMWQFNPAKYSDLVASSMYSEPEYDEMYRKSSVYCDGDGLSVSRAA